MPTPYNVRPRDELQSIDHVYVLGTKYTDQKITNISQFD